MVVNSPGCIKPNVNGACYSGFNYARPEPPQDSFWDSWLWKGLKIGLPIGLGFLCPGLGFLAASTLTSTTITGMSYLEKKGKKGTLSSEDQTDLAVDFFSGFLGAGICRLKVFQGANTYKSAFVKSAMAGGVSGAVVGGGGRIIKDLINTGDINIDKALEEGVFGLAGGVALGGAFGAVGHRIRTKSQSKTEEPVTRADEKTSTASTSTSTTSPVSTAKPETRIEVIQPTGPKPVPRRLLNHGTDEKTYRALERYIERRFGKMPDNPRDYAIWEQQVKRHLKIITRRCHSSEEELFRNSDFGVPTQELEVFHRVTRSVTSYRQYLRQNNPIEIAPPATLPEGAPYIPQRRVTPHEAESVVPIRKSASSVDVDETEMLAVCRYQQDRLNWVQSHHRYDGSREPGTPKVVPWSTDKVCYTVAPLSTPIATKNIQPCVSIIIKDPANGRHYLAHIASSNKVRDIKASLAGFDLSQCGVYIKEGTIKSNAVLKAVKALQQLGAGDRIRFIQCQSSSPAGGVSVISYGDKVYSADGHYNMILAWENPHLKIAMY